MKVLDILNPYKILKEEEMLEEAKLSSEFSIGFELEGICDSNNPELQSSGSLPGYHSANEPSGGAKVLLDLLNDRLGLGKGKIERDGSLNTNGANKTGHAWCFEYGSPIIPFNPSNINKISKFLTGLKDIGVVTNESCGFHTHISFKDITRDDVKWILFSIANDDELLNEVSEMQVDGEEPIKFYGYYANNEWFRALKVNGKLEDWSFNKQTDDKYLIMRIHPDAGTIEWRGPRNFINDGSNTALIKSYIKKLWKLILNIGKIVDSKEYNGFKKSEVLQRMVVTGKFDAPIEKINQKNAQEFATRVINNPSLLITLAPSKLEKLLKYSTKVVDMDYYGGFKQEELKKAWNKISTKNKELLIRAMCNRNDRQLLKVIYGNEKFDSVVTNILLKINDESTLRSLYNNLTLTTTEQLNQLLNKKIFSNDEKIKMMIDNQHIVSVESFKTIIDSKNFYLISRFKSIPIKIQRMLIRRNPYNIQYINNPDQRIIDELKKKYGEDIEEYILGVL